MKKLTACLVLLLAASSYLFSQNIIKGSVTDSAEKKTPASSVIALLRKADSVLVAFTRADIEGNFQLKTNDTGEVIILITHPSYADYIDRLKVPPQSVTDLGKISMFGKSQLLQEVVVTGSSIRLKGDTVEYKIDSSMVRAGASVEDLLKNLPGFQVDKNGKITAHGEAVQKVLVDGEEFFSDDPTIVTRNMLADAIDKIQVYDKKSDQAAFTGIDDGEKIKTIDLKLKADKKKGYFGKVEVGSDANKYWNNNAMLNLFQGKRKLALYGITSNTGKTGLDWNESANYGGESIEMGSYDYSIDTYDEFNEGNFYGEGLPKGWNGGIHYSNKWNADKIHINGNYQYKKLNTEASGSTNSQYILPDTLYFINDRGNSFSSKFRNSVRGIYEYQIDSSTSVKINAEGFTGQTQNVNHSLSESLNEQGNKVNNSDRRITSQADNKAVISSLLLRKKFKKLGRTLSLTVNQRYTENESEGFLNNSYNFFNADGLVTSQRVTDQQKVVSGIRNVVSSRIVYTEPLSKRAILEFNYGLNNALGRSSVTTLEKMGPGSVKYENMIDSLTNNYSLNVFTNTAGINYRFTKVKKINLSFGGNVSRADFTRQNLKSDSTFNYNFINLFPQGNLGLSFGQSGNLNFRYSGNTSAPSIEQIQPVRDNTDELNQRIGNPDLKQSFRQRFSVSYSSYKFLADRQIYTSLNYSPVSNDFSYINYIQPNGARLTKPVNVQGNYWMNAYLHYSKKLKKPNMRLMVYSDISNVRNVNFVNEDKNINTSFAYGLGTRLSFQKEKKYEISFSPRIGWNTSSSSIRPDVKTRYWTQDHQADVTFFLPKKFEFNTDVQMSIRQQTEAFPDNNNATRWNARLDKKIFKNDVGRIRFSAFDILDQNIGFQRNISSNFISERRYETLRRYFLLSFIWNFSKNGKPQQW